MFKILIVDDEAVVREGIRDNINWSELGFELVGDCENGSEAIEAVEKLQPDVVLTDIYMPFVDGIELARYISEKFPRIKVIILTGYDEFEYARQAVKLKVYDFLLKPITAAELKKVLGKVKADLEEEKKSMEDLSRLKMQLRESLPLLKERFLNRLVAGYLREGELEEKLKYFNIEFKGNNYLAIVIDIDDYGELGIYHPGADDELLLFAVFNITEELIGKGKNGVVFQTRSEKTVAILSGYSPEHLTELANNVSEEVRQSVEKYLKFTVTVGIGVSCSSLSDISESYKSAVAALDYRFLLGKNRVINITDMEQRTVRPSGHREKLENMLVSAVKTGTGEDTDRIVEELIKELKVSYVSVDRCYIRIQQIISSIANVISELGIEEKDIFENNTSPFAEVYRFKTLDDIEAWLKKFCRKVVAQAEHKRADFAKVQVLKAEEYIREHYNDPDISLSAVCKHLFISTSYFSLIFKNYTSETFIEYLTRIRIEKSKELLKSTNLKTYEIAEKVGYRDPHYFSLIFKKLTGVTPTEYRDKA